MKKIIILSTCILLSGCSLFKGYEPSVRYLYSDSYGPVYSADCNGGYALSTCYQLANQQCMGYRVQVVDKGQDSRTYTEYNQITKENDTYTSISRELIFRCSY